MQNFTEVAQKQTALFYSGIVSIFLRFILFIKRQAITADKTSAIMNVSHTRPIFEMSVLAKSEKNHATGSTNRNCLQNEITSDSILPPSA